MNPPLPYATAGDPANPPLLLVHGWLSHRGVWRQTLPALQPRFYCVAVDLLGFGAAPKPADGDYSVLAQAQRLLDLADALGFERFALAGHSMGGQISLYLAAALAPQRVIRLVSVSGVVSGRLSDFVERITYPMIRLPMHAPVLYRLQAWLCRARPYARFVFRPWFYDMDNPAWPDWEIDRRMALQPEQRISAVQAGQAIHAADLTGWLPKISAPTLAIFGRQDGTVPISDGELVQRLAPAGRLALIERCGHFPMYEQTAEYLRILQEFLD